MFNVCRRRMNGPKNLFSHDYYLKQTTSLYFYVIIQSKFLQFIVRTKPKDYRLEALEKKESQSHSLQEKDTLPI